VSVVRDQILAAALEIADERGLAAVSMRSVGERVGMSAMALYPHVASKEALLDGLVDLLLAEQVPIVERVPADADWWTRLEAMAQGVRDLAVRHPSAFPLLLARPSVTTDALRATDAVYQVLLDAGVPAPEVNRVERLVSTFALGYAASEVNGRFSKGTLSPRARRAQLAEEDIPAHYQLADYLDQPVDWSAEFQADLRDLRMLIEAIATRGTRRASGRA
jgi:AcrR family transcriptional regulator